MHWMCTQGRGSRSWLFIASLALLASHANADAIRLSSGEILNVTILETTDKTIRFVHPLLGELTLPRDQVEILPPPPPGEKQAPPPPVVESAPPAPAGTASAPAVSPPEEKKEWNVKLVLAAAITDGNTQNANISTIFTAVRETPRMKTTLDTAYFAASNDGQTSENRFTLGARNDWLNPGSKWFYFADARYDHDQFQSWDNRVQGHVGIGYHLIPPPKLRLDLLAGIGAIKEWGSDNTDVRPEGLLGAEAEYTFAEKHSIKASTTYYPDLSDIGEFRWVNMVAYSLVIDEKHDLSLTAGIQHEYQSSVDPGRKYNDTRAYVGIEMGF